MPCLSAVHGLSASAAAPVPLPTPTAAHLPTPLPLPPAKVLAGAAPGAPHSDRPATLGGTVIDSQTRQPVVGATVRIELEGGELDGSVLGLTRTDDAGAFVVEGLAGDWRVRLGSPRHELLVFTESLDADQVLVVEYRLRRPSFGAEVVVYGDRQREEISRQVITVDELRKVPGTFGDPVRALQSLPGVARPGGLEGSLIVRGAEGLNTGFYVDEMPVPYLFHMLAGKSVINPAFIDDVEFYAGGMPSRFGEVTQAAVNVRNHRAPVEGRRTLVDVNLFDASVASEWGAGDWTLRAAGRYAYVGAIIGAATRLLTWRATGSWQDSFYVYPAYWDLQGSAQRSLGQGQTAELSLLASRDTLVLSAPDVEAEFGDTDALPFDPTRLVDAGFGRLRARYRTQTETHTSDTWVAGGPQLQQNVVGDLFVNTEGPWFGRIEGWGGIARREDRWRTTPAQTWVLGSQLTVNRYTAEDYAAWAAEGLTATKDTQLDLSGYGEWQWRPGEWLLSPGLRLTLARFDGEPWFAPQPRLTLRRGLSDNITAKAFAGRFAQMPPVDRYAQGIGNPELELMTADQLATGLEWRSGPWSIDSSVYASRMRNLVQQDMSVRVVNPFGGDAAYGIPFPEYRDTTGLAYGWEGLFRLQPSDRDVWGWAALTVGRSLRQDAETGERFASDHDQPIALTLLAAWDFADRWSASGRFRLTSGHPYTPYTGVYRPSADAYEGLPGQPNSERFPTFHQLDLRIDHTWSRRRSDWSLYLDVFNAYWAQNPFAATYNHDYTQLLTTVHLPILPTLGVEARF